MNSEQVAGIIFLGNVLVLCILIYIYVHMSDVLIPISIPSPPPNGCFYASWTTKKIISPLSSPCFLIKSDRLFTLVVFPLVAVFFHVGKTMVMS